MASLLPVLGYSAIPVLAATIGAAATVWRKPGAQLTSIVQHFAAGVVFAAAAGELLPDMLHDKGAVAPVILGAAAGVALMLAIRAASKRVGKSAGQIAVTGIDVLIDGFVVSLGFIAGAGQGLLLTVALSIELLFLGLTVALALGSAGSSGMRVVVATAGVALLLPIRRCRRHGICSRAWRRHGSPGSSRSAWWRCSTWSRKNCSSRRTKRPTRRLPPRCSSWVSSC